MTRTEAERLAADMNRTARASCKGEYVAEQLGSEWVVACKKGSQTLSFYKKPLDSRK